MSSIFVSRVKHFRSSFNLLTFLMASMHVSFCGADWADAEYSCKKRCPTGDGCP